MSLLKQVVKGKLNKPHLLLLYGTDGVGKSTFGASAPSPIFLGTEDGTASLDVARFPAPKNYAQVIEAIEVLSKEPHDYKTLVIDSLDWLEPLVWEKVCKDGDKKKIEDFGYGKGFANALDEWRKMMNALKSLRLSKGMDIILIAHSQVRTFNDPALVEGYDRYQMKLNEKASALFREFVDCVLFANYQTFLKTNDQKKTKGLGDGSRKIYTQRRPAFDAKNRLGLPFELPFSWDSFSEAARVGNPNSVEVIIENINGLMGSLTDKALVEKVKTSLEKVGKDAVKLSIIEDKLKTLVV